ISGGFGTFLVMATDWAPREKVRYSYELLARYVMPRFQRSLVGIHTSSQLCQAQAEESTRNRVASIEAAHRAFEEKQSAPTH
ncbi:MAG TPA: LLM class flavin-dependent oxidoreductase, partial [Dehalococcoidia bacterium]|nr:LLM class flavin-dependent oxidoreductase [Dehalococcoidia bacterium]